MSNNKLRKKVWDWFISKKIILFIEENKTEITTSKGINGPPKLMYILGSYIFVLATIIFSLLNLFPINNYIFNNYIFYENFFGKVIYCFPVLFAIFYVFLHVIIIVLGVRLYEIILNKIRAFFFTNKFKPKKYKEEFKRNYLFLRMEYLRLNANGPEKEALNEKSNFQIEYEIRQKAWEVFVAQERKKYMDRFNSEDFEMKFEREFAKVKSFYLKEGDDKKRDKLFGRQELRELIKECEVS